ncbi:MAG: DUF6364 family protein [Terrimicrobiaceae bacterium]|nr:DUF6364 family protein [Terrimicrobiaceae bacterium]
MNTKLTLRLDEKLVSQAKREARKRGISVSKMVADYFWGIGTDRKDGEALPPATNALLGSLRGKKADRESYRRHLVEKHL